jgi:hypothetical protein
MARLGHPCALRGRGVGTRAGDEGELTRLSAQHAVWSPGYIEAKQQSRQEGRDPGARGGYGGRKPRARRALCLALLTGHPSRCAETMTGQHCRWIGVGFFAYSPPLKSEINRV